MKEKAKLTNKTDKREKVSYITHHGVGGEVCLHCEERKSQTATCALKSEQKIAHTHTHTHRDTHTQRHTHTDTHTHTHTHRERHTHTHTHTHTETHTHRDTHTQRHTHTQTRTRTQRHTETHTHTHSTAAVCSLLDSFRKSDEKNSHFTAKTGISKTNTE